MIVKKMATWYVEEILDKILKSDTHSKNISHSCVRLSWWLWNRYCKDSIRLFPFLCIECPVYFDTCKRELIILSRNLPDLWISFSKKRGDTPIKLIVINYAVLCLNYLMSTSTLYFVPDLKEQMQIKLFSITSNDINFQKHWLWKIEDAVMQTTWELTKFQKTMHEPLQ